jgi:hypothetical protein
VLLAAWLKVYPQIHTYSQKKKEPKKKTIVIIIPIKELNTNLKVTLLYYRNIFSIFYYSFNTQKSFRSNNQKPRGGIDRPKGT